MGWLPNRLPAAAGGLAW